MTIQFVLVDPRHGINEAALAKVSTERVRFFMLGALGDTSRLYLRLTDSLEDKSKAKKHILIASGQDDDINLLRDLWFNLRQRSVVIFLSRDLTAAELGSTSCPDNILDRLYRVGSSSGSDSSSFFYAELKCAIQVSFLLSRFADDAAAFRDSDKFSEARSLMIGLARGAPTLFEKIKYKLTGDRLFDVLFASVPDDLSTSRFRSAATRPLLGISRVPALPSADAASLVHSPVATAAAPPPPLALLGGTSADLISALEGGNFATGSSALSRAALAAASSLLDEEAGTGDGALLPAEEFESPPASGSASPSKFLGVSPIALPPGAAGRAGSAFRRHSRASQTRSVATVPGGSSVSDGSPAPPALGTEVAAVDSGRSVTPK